MKTKKEKVENGLPRYTGTRLGWFGKYILPTGFYKEVMALFSFGIEQVVSSTVKIDELGYGAGAAYTTDRRAWEYDKVFKKWSGKMYAMGACSERVCSFQ